MFNQIRPTPVGQTEQLPEVKTSEIDQDKPVESWPFLAPYIVRYGVQTREFYTTRKDN